MHGATMRQTAGANGRAGLEGTAVGQQHLGAGRDGLQSLAGGDRGVSVYEVETLRKRYLINQDTIMDSYLDRGLELRHGVGRIDLNDPSGGREATKEQLHPLARAIHA